jgi:peptidylprolyl isomerase
MVSCLAFALPAHLTPVFRSLSGASVSPRMRRTTSVAAGSKHCSATRLRNRTATYVRAAASAAAESEKEMQMTDPFLAGRGDVACPEVGFKPTLATGTARIAADRNVDMPSLSRMYGTILAGQMLELSIDEMQPEMVIDGIYLGWREQDCPMDVTEFESLMQSLMSEDDSEEASASEVKALSQMYGFMLGTTLRMSCLELDLDFVATGFRTRCTNPGMIMPLEPQEYDRQFMELQQIAGAMQFDSNLADADRFFEKARTATNMRRARDDASIIYLLGTFKAPESQKCANIDDTVLVVIAGRLLDGRAFLVPTFSDGAGMPADTVAIPLNGVPKGLSAGIIGMREGEVRTIYIHPKAADGVSALFTAQPFPPNSAIIFDALMCKIGAPKPAVIGEMEA